MSMMKRRLEQARDTMHYFVQVDLGDSLVWPERPDTSRKALLRDLRSKELKDVETILECNPFEGTCRDVTEDFLTFALEGDPLTETPAQRARIYDSQMERA